MAASRRSDRRFRHPSERNDQGLGNELIIRSETTAAAKGPVKCHELLGGLLRYYYREAA